MPELHALFHSLDADQSGRLSTEEFRRGLTRIGTHMSEVRASIWGDLRQNTLGWPVCTQLSLGRSMCRCLLVACVQTLGLKQWVLLSGSVCVGMAGLSKETAAGGAAEGCSELPPGCLPDQVPGRRKAECWGALEKV